MVLTQLASEDCLHLHQPQVRVSIDWNYEDLDFVLEIPFLMIVGMTDALY